MNLQNSNILDLIELLAKTIYSDSYTQYGTCSDSHWNKTSDVQKDFCRGQAVSVIKVLQEKNLINFG